MALGQSAGLSLHVASEWVQGLRAPERLLAFEAMVVCDPLGVAVVPVAIAAVAKKLAWEYVDGVLVIPLWPVKPANPNMRLAWLRALGERVVGRSCAARVIRERALAWGEDPGRALMIAGQADLLASVLPEAVESVALVPVAASAPAPAPARSRHFPLPAGAVLCHGVKGDYYSFRGRIEYPEPFNYFYRTYPKPVEKAEAYGVFLVLDPSPSEVQDIHEGVRRFAANPYTHTDGHKYVPYPARWLQRRRWEDRDVPIPMRTHDEVSQVLELSPGTAVFKEDDFT